VLFRSGQRQDVLEVITSKMFTPGVGELREGLYERSGGE